MRMMLLTMVTTSESVMTILLCFVHYATVKYCLAHLRVKLCFLVCHMFANLCIALEAQLPEDRIRVLLKIFQPPHGCRIILLDLQYLPAIESGWVALPIS